MVKSWEEEEGMRRGGKGKGGMREGRKGMKGGRSRECREVEEGRKLGKRKKLIRGGRGEGENGEVQREKNEK